jgi:acyl carrier protein
MSGVVVTTRKFRAFRQPPQPGHGVSARLPVFLSEPLDHLRASRDVANSRYGVPGAPDVPVTPRPRRGLAGHRLLPGRCDSARSGFDCVAHAVGLDDRLVEDLGAESIDQVTIIAVIEETYCVSADEECLLMLRTVRDLAADPRIC